MLQLISRACWGSALLLVMPSMVWLFGWQWQPDTNAHLLIKALFFITETVTMPWGIITSLLLAGWFIWRLRPRLKSAVVLFMALAAAILMGQGASSLIKNQVKEPRPFVLWLENQYQVDPDRFYRLASKQRAQLIMQQLTADQDVPPWLRTHWMFENGYAFPSGHAMFVASWALLAIVLLWPRRCYLTVTVIVLWAELVMLSRLMLGMHWPIDLAASVLISAVIVIVASYLVYYWGAAVEPERPSCSVNSH